MRKELTSLEKVMLSSMSEEEIKTLKDGMELAISLGESLNRDGIVVDFKKLKELKRDLKNIKRFIKDMK